MLVERASAAWSGQIIDLGGRNTLLFYKDLKQGTLDLTPSERIDAAEVDQLLDAQTVKLSSLVIDPDTLPATAKRARTVKAKATENFEERGLGTLLIAHGMATWHHARSDATPAAPVLLAPLFLKPRGSAGEDFELSIEGDWEVNPTLLHLLESDFEVDIESDDVLADGDGDFALNQLRQLAREVPGFSISDRVVVGNFSYAKQPMADDLMGSVEAMLAHPVVSAIAGSSEALGELIAHQSVVEPNTPDTTPPSDEFLILDADASQSQVINAALRGSNLVVQGPPGTGKSQTIANLIAACAAANKSVLFVAEKRAAIEAVTGRLESTGLDSLVLDLHGGTTSRRATLAELSRVLDGFGAVPAIDRTDEQRRLQQSRTKLNRYVTELHLERPAGMSVFELQAGLLGIPDGAKTGLSIPHHIATNLSPQQVEELQRSMQELVQLDDSAGQTGRPWQDAVGRITTQDQASQALDIAQQLSSQTVPEANQRLNTVIAESGLRTPTTLDQWLLALELLKGVASTLERFDPGIYSLDFAKLHADLEPAEKGAGSRAWAAMFNRAYRSARKTVRAQTGEKIDAADARSIIAVAWAHAYEWATMSVDGHGPRVATTLQGSVATFDSMMTQMAALGAFLGSSQQADDLTSAQRWATDLVEDRAALFRLPRIHELQQQIEAAGFGTVLAEVHERRLSHELAPLLLRSVWLRSNLDAAYLVEPVVGAFDSMSHQSTIREFSSIDRDHVDGGALRVKRSVAERAIDSLNEYPVQAQLVRQQARRKRGHMPLRVLLQQAPDVLLSVKPCWAMSPLIVSQLLPSDRQLFDIVVFDEASQIPPAEAIPAILRGKQVIVTGDTKQLPPTTFFAGSQEDTGSESGELLTDDMESILDAMVALLPPPHGSKTLSWHYRSRDEKLIAFSNAQESLYDWTLTTFPGVASADTISHLHVPWRPGVPGQEASAADEVEAVVALVAEHALLRPHESLGVITMGLKHADRINERIRVTRPLDRALDDFCNAHPDETFFVKNLERVQGDERDAIVISVGYGKSNDGRMQYRFGPINTQGGERRLNVAATRAKQRLTLVSSFGHEDMDDSRLNSEGAQMLKRYLQYAASGGTDLGAVVKPRAALNPFEQDVFRCLTEAGIPLTPQLGASGYWIDFAASHPDAPGRYVLAIEADGASYHSSYTARDRDRLRQDHLERLGWRFHRIWSTDWFNHRERCVDLAVAAWEHAVASDVGADGTAPAGQPVQAAPEPDPPDGVQDLAPTRTGRLPPIFRGEPITSYPTTDLDAIMRWIRSDTLLRTDDELIDEAIQMLGYHKRGSRIVTALQSAADRTR